MSRKRSVSSLLDDDDESPSNQPSTTAHPRRVRSISSIIDEEIEPSPKRSHNRVVCNCPDCNGNLVDPRTKEVHESRYQQSQDSQGTITGEMHQFEIGEASTSTSTSR